MTTNKERWLNEEHHHFYGRPWALGRDFARWVTDNVDLSDRLLDVGCGTGRVGRYLCRRFDRYVGFDPDTERLDAFRFEMATHDLCWADLYSSWDHVAEYEPEGFDTVLLVSVIQHLRGAELYECLRRSIGALVPDGRLLFSPEPPYELLQEVGLERVRLDRQKHEMLEGTKWQDWTEWSIWRKK